MSTDVKALQEQRTKLYYDFWNNIIPERIPVEMSVAHSVLATKGNLVFREAQYHPEMYAEIAEKVCQTVYSDRCPIPSLNGTTRVASYYTLLGAKCFKMVDTGFIQHPEVSSMNADEYDEFTADPYAFILEKAIPRIYDHLDPVKEPVKSMQILSIANAARDEDRAAVAKLTRGLSEKYGYTNGGPRGCMGSTEAAFDFLADLLRSFSGVSVDIRRNPQKLLDACDALYPLVFKLGMPESPHFCGVVNIPIHMPPFMRPKDFDKLYLPTLRRMAEDYAAVGVRLGLFLEADCTHHIDTLADLPSNLVYRFERSDPKLVKEKLGDKFILSGMYPIQMLDDCSKEDCLKKLQELLDIMMPGGGYQFSFDKGLNGNRDVNLENMNAVAEYLRDHAVYGADAGKPYGKKLNNEGFEDHSAELMNIKSKYTFNWDEFLKENPYTPESARPRLERYHNDMFKYWMNLLF